MNRAILYTLCAALMMVATPQAEAGKGHRGKKSRVSSKASSSRQVRVASRRIPRATRRSSIRRHKAPRAQRLTRRGQPRVVKRQRAGNWASRKAAGARQLSSRKRSSSKVKSSNRRVSRRTFVRIPLSRLNKRDRAQVMGLMLNKRVRSSRAARALIGEYVRLAARKGTRGLPLGIKDLKQMVTSGRWSSKRMSNLAKVLRLANYLARRDKIGGKAAFNKALKAAGVYNKYYSGKCGV